MAMAIKLGGAGDLTGTDAVLWKFTRGTPYVSSPLLYGGNLYFFQHINALLTCLDAATGKPYYTQERLEGVTSIYASPIGVNDRIYIAGREGTTLVIEKSTTLKILASNILKDGFDASPAVVGNELFLRGRANLYCIAEL
jgi:outer membrane protein assembly factor BamB